MLKILKLGEENGWYFVVNGVSFLEILLNFSKVQKFGNKGSKIWKQNCILGTFKLWKSGRIRNRRNS